MTKKHPIIIGGGGGGKGGGGGGATEAPNSLRSKQIAHIVDVLGEGEWEGLIDGPGGIYLNDVALFDPTTPTNDVVDLTETASEDGTWTVPGTWNFKGVSVEFRHGTQSQSAVRVASSLSFVQSVALAVVHGSPVIANITNPNVDLAVVNIQLDQLYQQDTSNGNVSGYYVDLTIEARHGTGAWTVVKADRIDGKTMSSYVRSYAVNLHDISTSAPWDIRVTRVSANDPDSSKHSTFSFLGMDLMSRDKFRYPNSALCSIGVDASQLGSIPTRAYNVKMARIRVPSNYNPTTRAYTGVWDGSFQIAWSDNPAWCLYDMVTSTRYGLGSYVDEALVDKWALYTIAKYCDALVPDGFGSYEPRFTLNAFIQSPEEAITVVQNLASVFRGILYYINESLTAIQDAPANSVYQFNTSNVKDGIFTYAGASISTRHTVALVVWNNPELNYKQDVEYVEDPAGLLRFGYRPVTVQAFGCTSRGQAHRLGLWALYVEQYEADLITFSTTLEGTGIQPGSIVDVFDPVRANVRMGGRVLGVAGQTITVDKGVPVAGGTHVFAFIADDGTLVNRSATLAAGTHSTILLDGTGAVPSLGSVFGVQTASVESQQVRVVSISESDRHTYEITAVAYNSSKYAYIEDGLQLVPRPTRALTTPLPAPTDFVFTESLYLLADGSIRNRLIVSWGQNQQALNYMVSYRVGSDSWSEPVSVSEHQFLLASVVEGWLYSFRVSATNLVNVQGIQAEVTYTVLGAKAPPPIFDVLTVGTNNDGTRSIAYGYTVTEKPLDYLGAQVRYKVGSTTDWNSMTPLFSGFFTYSPIETGQVDPGHYTVAVCAEDQTHTLSTPKFVEVDLTAGPPDLTDLTDAYARIASISSDNMLDRSEKRANQVFWQQIIDAHDAIVARATALAPAVNTEEATFVSAYGALVTYLTTAYNVISGEGVGTGGTDWSDVTTDSTIDGPTFRAKFNAVFVAYHALEIAIVAHAQSTADGAVASFTAASARIDIIASDNMLSAGEKRANDVFWKQIIAFHDTDVAKATALGITTELTAFTTAYNAMLTYLSHAYNAGTGDGVGLGGTDWSNVATDSQINGTVFRSKFNDVFTTGQTLDAKITAVAQATADTALTNAATAFASATTANTAIAAINSSITAITSDNVFSKSEKSATKVMFADIQSWHDNKIVEANTLGITTERTNFINAYNELVRYLGATYNSSTHDGVGTGGTDWSDVTTDSTIDGPTFRAKFTDVTNTAAILDTKINAVNRVNTAAAQTDATTALANAATVSAAVTIINTQVTNITSDNVLSKSEKAGFHSTFDQVSSWYTAKSAEANTLGITTERTAMITAMNAWNTYLTTAYNGGTLQGVGTGGSDWSTVTTDSTIDGATFRSKMKDVTDAAATLDTKINAVNRVNTAAAQGDATTGISNAATAQSTANTALTNAATAFASATTANTAITAINSAITAITADNVFSKSEKSATKVMFADIQSWHDNKIVEANTLGITTERTNFINAYNELVRYLGAAYNGGTLDGVGTGGTDWSDVTTDSTIDGPTFRTKFNDTTNTAAILDTKINAVNRTNTATAQGTANTGVSNAATAQTTANSAVTNAATAQATADAKLNKSASDTLTGVIATSTGGGIKTGTITWDSSGNLTGGTGVAVTAKGIVGAASGVATFTIDATTGAATFKGDIVSGSTISGATITGSTVRTAASGARIEISSGTLIATNSSGNNLVEIDNTGKVLFTGGTYDPFGGSNYGAAVARIGTVTNTSAITGFLGYNERSSGGQAIAGFSISTNTNGIGVSGQAAHASSIGVYAANTASGVALQLLGSIVFDVGRFSSLTSNVATFAGTKPGNPTTNIWREEYKGGTKGWVPWWPDA